MKHSWIILLLVCLTAACSTKSEFAISTRDDSPATSLLGKDFGKDLEQKLGPPMRANVFFNGDKYIGYVERMGRIPDRFDYLYEAAFACLYAQLRNDEKDRSIIITKSEEYFATWQVLSRKPEQERVDYWMRDPEISEWMISKYQAILAYDPDHRFKEDMISAIQQLKDGQ